MPRDHDAVMQNLVVLEQVADHDRGTRVAHRHRIATTADGHEGIGGHHAVPRALVPVVMSLIREHKASSRPGGEEERPLYAVNEDEPETKERHSDEF